MNVLWETVDVLRSAVILLVSTPVAAIVVIV